jgi:hypothetical protein
MIPLLISVCLAGIGSIVSVCSYWPELEREVERVLQVVGLGLIGAGTMLGFWSVLLEADHNGLLRLILGLFLLAIAITAAVVYRFRGREPELLRIFVTTTTTSTAIGVRSSTYWIVGVSIANIERE